MKENEERVVQRGLDRARSLAVSRGRYAMEHGASVS
jgi:hypothetical protein